MDPARRSDCRRWLLACGGLAVTAMGLSYLGGFLLLVTSDVPTGEGPGAGVVAVLVVIAAVVVVTTLGAMVAALRLGMLTREIRASARRSGGPTGQMNRRRPLKDIAAIGGLGWPIGYFGFGGFENDTGAAIIGSGCIIALVALAADGLLRLHERRRDPPRA